jgi:hypothetical protein
MLDVHAPHKPLHSVLEFFLHLLTITVGLLIATQIESCVEWRHHVHLAEEARAALRTEIQTNLQAMKKYQPRRQKLEDAIQSNTIAARYVRNHPDSPKERQPKEEKEKNIEVNSLQLTDTAWKTAQATGAIAYMPYDEAQEYANIYQTQAGLLADGDKNLDGLRDYMSRLNTYDLIYITRKNMVAEEAVAELQVLEKWHSDLVLEDYWLNAGIELNASFLENRRFHPIEGRSLDNK